MATEWTSPHLGKSVALKRAVLGFFGLLLSGVGGCLTTESVQGASLAFEGVDHVHGGDGLPLGVLRVSDGVADHVLQEHLEHPAGLLVDEAGDALHSTTARQAADGGLGDALDVIAQHLAVTLSSPLSQTFSSFASARHDFAACYFR